MPRCHATAHRTGVQCGRWARKGYAVCSTHGAGTKARPGGRPLIHGAYSKFLTPAQVVDFAYFREHFDLTDDLAFACTKIYHAVNQVDPQQLPALLEVPSKIALRRKQVLEGVTLRLDIDVTFLQGFMARIFTYVTDHTHRQQLLAYLQEHVGESLPASMGRTAEA